MIRNNMKTPRSHTPYQQYNFYLWSKHQDIARYDFNNISHLPVSPILKVWWVYFIPISQIVNKC